MAFWQGMQLNFFRSGVRETAKKFNSLVAKFFTPMPLKWEHWWYVSALSEKFYCPKFILDILWVKMKLKQGRHYFSQKHTGYGQRGFAMPPCPLCSSRFKMWAVFEVTVLPQPPLGLSHWPGCEHCKGGERTSLILGNVAAVSWRHAWRRQKDGSNCSFTLLRDRWHPEEKILPCREHKSGAAFRF